MTASYQIIRAAVLCLLGENGAAIAKVFNAKPLADYSESRFGQEPCEAEREDMRNRLWWARFWMNLRIWLAVSAVIVALCFSLQLPT